MFLLALTKVEMGSDGHFDEARYLVDSSKSRLFVSHSVALYLIKSALMQFWCSIMDS
jgi:hypothetical protein